jgi:predicted nucleic acid-binding protein
VCIDASVAVKWFAPEQDSDLADALLAQVLSSATRLVTPPHFEPEITSALAAKVRAGEVSLPAAQESIEKLGRIDHESVREPPLNLRALELTVEFKWSFPYDAYYLAVGELLDCDVWTADERFHRTAHDRYPRLRLLSEYESA